MDGSIVSLVLLIENSLIESFISCKKNLFIINGFFVLKFSKYISEIIGLTNFDSNKKSVREKQRLTNHQFGMKKSKSLKVIYGKYHIFFNKL